jgi:hypothetical protein
MSATASKPAQTRTDQVPSITSKSSGIEYVKANIAPPQGEANYNRKPSTKNDKGS